MAAPPQAGPTRAPGGQSAKPSHVATRIVTLKKRPEFLATRKGARWACRNFVVEALKRAVPAVQDATETAGTYTGPRFGFTVSKQNGKAVDRNRIKRRLRAVVSQLQSQCAAPLTDYVVIARRPALDAPFESLLADMTTALTRVSQERRPGMPSGTRSGGPSGPPRSKPPTKSSSS